MGTAQDSVVGKVFNLVGEMEITAESEVRKGEMVTTPSDPPRRAENEGRQSEMSGRKYVGIEGTIDWGDGEKISVRPCHQELTARPCN